MGSRSKPLFRMAKQDTSTTLCFLSMELSPETIDHIRWGSLQLILLIVSVGLHEFGHAWVADLRGDPLPRAQGRVTLNPLAHADMIGTILIPAVMVFLSPGFGIIGWGKPVQISLMNPKTRRLDDILITLAGPAMNIVLCLAFVIIGVVGGLNPNINPNLSGGTPSATMVQFLYMGIFLNVSLAIFNLIPLPPLDGSRIFLRLGIYTEEVFESLARWSFIILIILINLPFFREFMVSAMKIVALPFLLFWELLWPIFT